MSDPTCEARIDEHLASRLDDLRAILDNPDGVETDDDYLPPINEYGLSLGYVEPYTFNDQPRGYIRYQLSWGGPSDEFRFYLDEQRQPVKVEYWFLDWFDGACRPLSGDDLALLETIFDWFDAGTLAERS